MITVLGKLFVSKGSQKKDTQHKGKVGQENHGCSLEGELYRHDQFLLLCLIAKDEERSVEDSSVGEDRERGKASLG